MPEQKSLILGTEKKQCPKAMLEDDMGARWGFDENKSDQYHAVYSKMQWQRKEYIQIADHMKLPL